MKEEFLHYLWKYQLIDTQQLKTNEDENIKIINPGNHNANSGPDFFNASIVIGTTLWVGNVEIHYAAIEWYTHKHHLDSAYDNVILHVVVDNNKTTLNTRGRIITTIEISWPESLYVNYLNLIGNNNSIPCRKVICQVPDFVVKNWSETLGVERLKEKSKQVDFLLNHNRNDWEESFYQRVASCFGLKQNVQPFEQLSRKLPLKNLARHKNNIVQIEALIYGQAGFLEDEAEDYYYKNLKNEYDYLALKYSLKPMDKSLWKFMRLRPLNFPTIRLAQFAMLIHQSSALFSKVLECSSLSGFKKLFSVETSEYWNNHYRFHQSARKKIKRLGDATIHLILINAVIPFLFVYGKRTDCQKYIDKSIHLFENLPSESNSITNDWKELGVSIQNALDSQGLIHLKKEYCHKKKCLYCRIGNHLIKQLQ